MVPLDSLAKNVACHGYHGENEGDLVGASFVSAKEKAAKYNAFYFGSCWVLFVYLINICIQNEVRLKSSI